MSRLLSVPLVLVSATLFMGALVPNLFVLAPKFLAARDFNAQQIGIVMGGFNIAALVTTPVVGRVTERLGHSMVLVAGCLIAGAGCLAFDQADSTVTYGLARAIQGFGFAAILVAAAAYVAEISPPDRLAQALGIAGVLTLCSQAAGPFLGEILEHALGWRWVFRAGAMGGVVGALVASTLPRVVEQPTASGDGRLSAWPALIATALAGFGFGSVWSFLADYTTRVGVGAVTPFFFPYVIAAISTRVFFGHVADRIGRTRVAVPALFGHATALAFMAALASRSHLVGIGLMFGLSHGFYYPALQAMVIERSHQARSRAIAGSTFSFGLGIVVSAFGLGALAKSVGYPPIYLVSSGAGVLAATIVWARG